MWTRVDGAVKAGSRFPSLRVSPLSQSNNPKEKTIPQQKGATKRRVEWLVGFLARKVAAACVYAQKCVNVNTGFVPIGVMEDGNGGSDGVPTTLSTSTAQKSDPRIPPDCSTERWFSLALAWSGGMTALAFAFVALSIHC